MLSDIQFSATTDMSGTPSQIPSDMSTPESRVADQARIRKERREAKIRAGGSARLDKITGLGGGIKKDISQATAPGLDSSADPEEVDISQHFYQTTRSSRLRTPNFTVGNEEISDDQLRAMMLGNTVHQTGLQSPSGNTFTGIPGMENLGAMGEANDPMMKMLSQMVGDMGGSPGEGLNGMPSFPGLPPMGMPGAQGGNSSDPYAFVWRIVHAVFALGLGLYIVLASTFSGSKFDRDMSALHTTNGISGNIKFFYVFATVEVLLQSSRFFIEKGRARQTGVLGMVMGLLPEPYKGYLALILRYSRIWTTVSTDAMVCLFVLGAFCWITGAV